MALTRDEQKTLRAQGHRLKPVVIIGSNGLTESVRQEIDSSLEHHELMKVKVNAGDREERDAMIGQICDSLGADLVQRIGNVALIFRRAQDNGSR